MRAPLPHIHIQLTPVATLLAMPHREKNANQKEETMEPTDTNAIWRLPSKADVGWISMAVPPTERVNLFAKGDGFDLMSLSDLI
jgi:hypothetical protein